MEYPEWRGKRVVECPHVLGVHGVLLEGTVISFRAVKCFLPVKSADRFRQRPPLLRETLKPLPRLACKVCARPPLNHHLRHGNRFFLQSDNHRIRSARGHPSFHPLVPDVADGESNGEGVDGQQKSAVFVGRRAPLTSDNRYVRERERRFVRGINNSPLDSTWLSPNVST